jgi:hypothetical protein
VDIGRTISGPSAITLGSLLETAAAGDRQAGIAGEIRIGLGALTE